MGVVVKHQLVASPPIESVRLADQHGTRAVTVRPNSEHNPNIRTVELGTPTGEVWKFSTTPENLIKFGEAIIAFARDGVS